MLKLQKRFNDAALKWEKEKNFPDFTLGFIASTLVSKGVDNFKNLSQEELEKYIYSCGFYRAKAAHILSATQDILHRFGGEVPGTIEELMSLAGVGKKTANVVYSVAFGGDAIAVDTHVFRVSNRLGLAKGKTPLEVEAGLQKAIPQKDWSKAHHWLIYHGRRVCHSQRPDCANCALNALCDFYKKK